MYKKNNHQRCNIPPVLSTEEITKKTEHHPNFNVTLNTSPSPYPKVIGSHEPETVSLLKLDYAGASGELTAITQYIFQNISIQNNESFANALLRIAISEMSHLHMLGDAIKVLGGDLRFNDNRHYWNAGNIDYSLSFDEMLRANIKSEQIAIDNYKKHAAFTKNESVRDLLLRIAEDEKLHLRFFQETFTQIGH